MTNEKWQVKANKAFKEPIKLIAVREDIEIQFLIDEALSLFLTPSIQELRKKEPLQYTEIIKSLVDKTLKSNK